MKAVILAAGEGRRLRSLTHRIPKPMLPIAGRPLLVYIIELLRRHGIRDIAINLHHRPQAITGVLGDGSRYGVRITYSVEERLLGSAGALKPLERFLGAEPFLVVYGDVFTNLDLAALCRFHAERGAALTMALYRPDELSACGVAELSNDQRVLGFIEKPPPGAERSRWASAGVYAVEPPVLSHVTPRRPFDFGYHLIPLLIQRGVPVYGYVSDAFVHDIGTPAGYERAQRAAGRLVAAGNA